MRDKAKHVIWSCVALGLLSLGIWMRVHGGPFELIDFWTAPVTLTAVIATKLWSTTTPKRSKSRNRFIVSSIFAGCVAAVGIGYLSGQLVGLWHDFTQPWATLIAGCLVLIGASLTFWSSDLNRQLEKESSDRTHHADLERSLRERFVAATNLLADKDRAATRTAGAHVMAALAGNWVAYGTQSGQVQLGEAERQICVEQLCAYLRADVGNPRGSAASSIENHVRASIVAIIRSNSQAWHTGERVSLDLQGADLAGANLEGADLRTAVLRGACLDGATLSHALLDGVNFDRVSLVGADLTGASLEGSLLEGAVLTDARLTVEQPTEKAAAVG